MFYSEIKESIARVGVKKGDLIFVQSSLLPFLMKINSEHHNVFLKETCNAIIDSVGTEGTVCFPTFSYSMSTNKVYNPNEPPINANGLLATTMWKTKKCLRTMDPIFSVCAIGRLEKELTQDVPKTCFGKDSFFDRFYRRNGKLLQVGFGFDRTAFVIYFDQRLKNTYRYLKRFSGMVQKGKKLKKETWVCCVRKLDGTVITDLEMFKNRVEEDGIVQKTKIMDSYIYCADIKSIYTAVKGYFKEDPLFFIKH